MQTFFLCLLRETHVPFSTFLPATCIFCTSFRALNIVFFGWVFFTAGYSDVRIIGFDGEGMSHRDPKMKMKTSVRAGNAVGGGKFSVVPYGGSKPEHPNVRNTLQSFRGYYVHKSSFDKAPTG